MHINYIAYYHQNDGYGRYNSRLIKGLQNLGVSVKIATQDHRDMPAWMQEQEGLDWNNLTISSLPPYLLKDVPGRHWLQTMLEGSVAPVDWVETINNSNVERVIVPCEHNRVSFINSGVVKPISVVVGGTDPDEFPIAKRVYQGEYNLVYPYTFLTIADRGFRKGWEEVWTAFYKAFGGKTTGIMDVRLIIKSRPRKPGVKTTTGQMSSAHGADKRIIYQTVDADDMYPIYAQADCLALPSRCEGFGMPHREAAMMGLPVITQRHGGLDDGFTEQWSIPLTKGQMRPVPKEHKPNIGEWMVADTDELAMYMRSCYEDPALHADVGMQSAHWLRMNQTWEHSAEKLIGLMGEPDGTQETSFSMEYIA